MSPPQNKRKRPNPPGSQSTASFEGNSITRSQSSYFEDGNIVLIAEDVAFRVHKSVIGRQSEVFRDMLALEDQPADAETFDGCPVVRLSDSKDDIADLLAASYDGTKLNVQDVETMAALLRMSSKYLIDDLRAYAMQALHKMYPDTLSDWDRYQLEHPGGPADRGAAWAILDLVGADILLPSVHYELCDWNMSNLVGYEAMLPQHILQTHCKGRQVMASKLVNFIEAHILGGAVCIDFDQNCSETWKAVELSSNAFLRNLKYYLAPNPLYGLQSFSEANFIPALCRKCKEAILEAVQVEREEIWMSLPATFGFESWEELCKSHEDIL